LLIILDWTILGQNKTFWILVSLGLTLSVTWWYWTMKLVRKIIDHRLVEVEILSNIVGDIKEIREDIKKLDQKT
jgi:hypothetical protein